MPKKLHTPKETSRMLGIASSTLRLWAAKFADVLSPYSQPARHESGRPARRMYNDDDLRVLAKAKQLLRDGLRFPQALAALQDESPEETLPAIIDEPGALATAELVKTLQVLADQKSAIDDLQERLSRLEKSRKPPWWWPFGR